MSQIYNLNTTWTINGDYKNYYEITWMFFEIVYNTNVSWTTN